MKNLDLLNKALEVTTKNVTKKRGSSNRITTNDRILKLLFEDKLELTRVEIVNHITYQRTEESMDREITSEDFKNEEFLASWAKLSKTVKNSVDTSISKSNNNASFHYNEKYNEYLLVVSKLGTYKIIKNNHDTEPQPGQPTTSKKSRKSTKSTESTESVK